jgi:putative NIF3 family GTP cyclohydrolase 1 type 2
LLTLCVVFRARCRFRTVRLAVSPKHSLQSAVKRVAMCAGSGGSVVKSARADVYLTGTSPPGPTHLGKGKCCWPLAHAVCDVVQAK